MIRNFEEILQEFLDCAIVKKHSLNRYTFGNVLLQ